MIIPESKQKGIQKILDEMDLEPIGMRLRQDMMKDVLTLELSLQINKRSTLSAEAVTNMDDRGIVEWIDFTIRRSLPDFADILAQVYCKMRAREGVKQWTRPSPRPSSSSKQK